MIDALVHGTGHEPLASLGCSGRTIRRRPSEWPRPGLVSRRCTSGLEAYDRMIGLGLADLAIDGSITKSHLWCQATGRGPVDRGEQVPNAPSPAT